MYGIPPGVGVLFPPSVRRRMKLSVIGSLGLSALDMLGVLAMVPLLQLVAGIDPTTGALGRIGRFFGVSDVRSLILLVCGVILGAFTVKAVLTIAFRRWQTRFIGRQQADIAAELLQRYLEAPYAFHLRRNPADLLYVVGGAVGMAYGAVVSLLSMITEVTTIVVLVAVILVAAPLPAAAVVVYFAAVAYAVQRFTRSRQVAAGRIVVDENEVANRTLFQALFAVKELKLRHAGPLYAQRYRARRATSADAASRASIFTEAPKYLFDVVFVFGAGLLALGLFATDADQPVVVLGLFVAAGSRLLPAVVRLIGSLGALRVGQPALEQLVRELKALDDVERTAAPPLPVTDVVPAGDIVLDDVHFAYSDALDVPVLDGVDLTIPQGTSLAIVGTSGAGKSTLVDLILGLHRPTAGQIRVGEMPIEENLPGWQSTLSVVPQDVYLTDGSVRENIAFAESPTDVDEQRVAVAVQRAQLASLVAELPRGMDQYIGERGMRLSGGQRQRIGIARALYRDPAVLILDEATSALDNRTERDVTDTINGLRGQLTLIVIAHRLSTVRDCDHLVFMDRGKVAAQGTFEEVQRLSPQFAALVELGSLRSVDDARDEELS